MVTMEFPGFGIDTFEVNKIAFTLFGKIEVRWYGILITLGMIFAVLYAIYRGKAVGFTSDDIVDYALSMIVPGLIGARLYYVISTVKIYSYDSFLDVIAIWNGGLAIYGGLIGGFIGGVICSIIKKKNMLCLFDFAAPGAMMAQALGRWGNFCNGEAYGTIISENSFLYFTRMGILPNTFSSTMVYVYPAFLYESLWNFIGFWIANFMYSRKKFNGQIVLFYTAWYGFGRMFIEGLRSDSLYTFGGRVRVSQLLGAVCFAIGLTGLVLIMVGIKKGLISKEKYSFLCVEDKKEGD